MESAMKKAYEFTVRGALVFIGGWIAGVGMTLSFGIPWVPVSPYILTLTGVFMIIAGVFTIHAIR